MDRNHPIFPDIAGWSETRRVGAWSPESDTGLWLGADLAGLQLAQAHAILARAFHERRHQGAAGR